MSFKIKNIIATPKRMMTIGNALARAINTSRFTANLSQIRNGFEISTIRLRQSKDYCGNHPLPCPIRPGGHRPHKHLPYLEGADWVAFNDMLNDVLDRLKVSANVASSHVIIRKGDKRCVEYDSQPLRNGIDNEWVRDSGCFECRIGIKSPRSDYPPGTPGIPEYKI
jgi:hypothetical protein